MLPPVRPTNTKARSFNTEETRNMAPPNNPRTARVALEATRDSRTFVNTFHVARLDEAILSASDIANIANAVASWWDNNYRHNIVSGLSGLQVVATKQDPADPIQVTVPLTSGSDGSGGIDPADVTGAVSWRTGLAGRKFRGRY